MRPVISDGAIRVAVEITGTRRTYERVGGTDGSSEHVELKPRPIG